ncbi:hypothetical protein J6590_079368 [Homalodisca vitripennis]|nr:hypothetical protein J6590_079368 [Homalodisca vitripennis]
MSYSAPILAILAPLYSHPEPMVIERVPLEMEKSMPLRRSGQSSSPFTSLKSYQVRELTSSM